MTGKHVEHHPFRTGLGVHKALQQLESAWPVSCAICLLRVAPSADFDLIIELAADRSCSRLPNGFCAHLCHESIARP